MGFKLVFNPFTKKLDYVQDVSGYAKLDCSNQPFTGRITSTAITCDTNTLYVDSTNHRVGIGTIIPSTILEVTATTVPIFTRDVGNGPWTTPQSAVQIGLANSGSAASEVGPSFLFFANNSSATKSFLGRLNAIWENATAGSEAGAITFSVRANTGDTTATTERMRITSGGKVGIGTGSTVLSKLDTVQTGSDTVGTNLAFSTSASATQSFGYRYSADASKLIMDRLYGGNWSAVMSWDRSNGNIGIGITAPSTKLSILGTSASTPSSAWINSGSPLITAFGETTVGNGDYLLGFASDTTTARPVMLGRKSRGTLASPTTLVNGDQIFSFLSSGFDGTTFLNTAAVDFFVDGNVSNGNVPARISLVTGTNSGNRTERMRVDNAGLVSIGTAGTGRFNITGSTDIVQLKILANATQTSHIMDVWASNATTSLFNIDGSGNVGIGNQNPSATLHIISTSSTGILLERDGQPTFQCDGYGTGNVPLFISRQARGTKALPTASKQSDALFYFGARGYGATAFSSGSKAVFGMYASQDWTDSAQGTYITLETTPNGSTTRAERIRIDQSGYVGIGTTTPGSPFDVFSNQIIGARFINTGSSGSSSGAGMIGYSDDGASLGAGDRLGFFLLGGATDSSHTLVQSVGITGYASEAWSGSAQGGYLTFVTTPSGSTTSSRAERMRITDVGAVGVGCNPSSFFHVYSPLPAGGDSNANTPFRFDKVTATTNAIKSFALCSVVSSGDMVDGFGGRFKFLLSDTGATDKEIAAFGAIRDGADGRGALLFQISKTDNDLTEAIRITSEGNLQIAENGNLILGTSTGTKIGTSTSQKLGFWNATPIVQPTTGITAATLVSNGGTTLTSTDTFDGYTLQQIVKALRNAGLLQ